MPKVVRLLETCSRILGPDDDVIQSAELAKRHSMVNYFAHMDMAEALQRLKMALSLR